MLSLLKEPGDSKRFDIAYLPDNTLCHNARIHKSEFLRKIVCSRYRSGFAIYPMLHEVEKCIPLTKCSVLKRIHPVKNEQKMLYFQG